VNFIDPLGLDRYVVDSIHPKMIIQEATPEGQRTGRLLVVEYGPGATSSMHDVVNNFAKGSSSDMHLIQASLYEGSYTASMTALLLVTQGFLSMGQPHLYEFQGNHSELRDAIYIPSSPSADALLLKALSLSLGDTQPYIFWIYNSRDWMRDWMYIGCPDRRHIPPF
jgi:hypothetical protein